jgi:hypothetical protein
VSRPLLAVVGVVTVAIGWAVPLLGISLAAFLLVDLVIALVGHRRRPLTASRPRISENA